MRKHEIHRPDELTRTFEITGPKDVVERVTSLLATMRWLGGIGASREIKFGWDGDGPERFECETGVDLKDYIDACQFVEDEQMCKEEKGEAMDRIDKLIDAVEKGADPGFLVERETAKQEAVPQSCEQALMDAGFNQVSVSPDGQSKFSRGNQEIVLFDDGSYWAYEGGRILNPPTGGQDYSTERDCYDLLKDGWPDIIFY